jgi:hypothetical protein
MMRSLGYEPDANLHWAVGNRLREVWYDRTGQLPEKALSRKTAGSGSHCFATYPDAFRPDAERIARGIADALAAERERQPGLF